MTQPEKSSKLGANELVDGLRHNPKTAISKIYDTYAPALYGIVLRILGSEAEAEDVLQETFIAVWQARHAYDASKGTLFTWMLNIARRKAIDKLRARESRQKRQVEKGELNRHLHPEIDTIGLRDHVARMDPKFRQVLELVYFKGYTQAEVQKTLGLPLGTVKSRVRLALKHLREIYIERVSPLLVIIAEQIFMGS